LGVETGVITRDQPSINANIGASANRKNGHVNPVDATTNNDVNEIISIETEQSSSINSSDTINSTDNSYDPLTVIQTSPERYSETSPLLEDGVSSWEDLRAGTFVDKQYIETDEIVYSEVPSEVTGIPTVPNEVDVTDIDAPESVYSEDVFDSAMGIEQQQAGTQPHYQSLPQYSTTESSNTNYDIWSRIRSGYTIPHIDHPLIDRYVAWNQTHAEYVTKMLTRSTPYMFYIVEQIEARGLPMELALLPAIESAYKPRALSRSKASGLWQFVPITGKHFGMRQDWWSDQRRDVIISTNKALDYLSELNRQFDGDWLLAMAAYNGGRGTISRAIRRNQRAGLNTDYFSLDLRRETAHYVPKIIGLSRVLMDPYAFGINIPEIPNHPYFETVALKGQTDLVKLISNSDISKKSFDLLNPQYLRWASDPQGPHRVLVPLSSSLSVANYVSTLNEQQKILWRKHQLASGDTLSGLARRYGVSTSAIRSINGMNSSRLRAGKTILIPIRNNHSAAHVSNEVAQANTSVQSSLNQTATISSVPILADTNSRLDLPLVHTVVPGDTLWSISRRYDISIDTLLSLNGLK